MRRFHAFAVTTALLTCAAELPAQSAAPGRSVLDGVFTTGQAARGKEAFIDSCATCHVSSQFTDPSFPRAWSGRPLRDMFEFIRSSMPNDMPGSLSRATYADIIAYILSLNGFPAGETELPGEDEPLGGIRMEARPSGGAGRALNRPRPSRPTAPAEAPPATG